MFTVTARAFLNSRIKFSRNFYNLSGGKKIYLYYELLILLVLINYDSKLKKIKLSI